MKTNHKLALTLLAGLAGGLIAGQEIQAQQPKPRPGYIIAETEIDPNKPDNPAAMKKYAEEVPKTLVAFGGKTIIASPSNKVQGLEGEAPKGFVTVLAFDSVEKAHAWYDSPPYKAIAPLRENARKSRVLLVEGAAPNQ